MGFINKFLYLNYLFTIPLLLFKTMLESNTKDSSIINCLKK